MRQHNLYPIFIILSLLSFALLLINCKGKGEVKPKTKTELLTEREWQGEKAKIAVQSILLTQEQEQSISTITLKFKKDGSFTLKNADAPEQTGTWEFTNNETKIRLKNANIIDLNPIRPLLPAGATLPAIPELFDIEELTANTFIFKGNTTFTVPIQDFPIPIPVQVNIKPKFIRP